MGEAATIVRRADRAAPAVPGRRPGPPYGLLALVVAAVAVRLLTAILLPSVVYPDETFQLIEQANRVVTGRGLVPWEFAVGARSWLLPGLLVPLVGAGRALSADPRVALGFVTAAMTALAAAGVWAAYALGRKAGGPLHALFAAGLVALWPELVYFSPHVLADTVSAGLLLCGLSVCAQPERPRRLFWGGLLLGAALVVRIQLAPAIGLAGLTVCGRDLRRYLIAAAGFALPVAALGLVDWATLGVPFSSVLVYLRVNASGTADAFGRSPTSFYPLFELAIWGLGAPLVALAAALGARRAPALAATAVAIVATFSLVGHKEPRFVYPALPILFVLCGVGSAEIVRWAQARLPDGRGRRVAVLVMAAAWAAAGATAATSPLMRQMWRRDQGVLRAFATVNADPQSCGLGLTPASWWRSGHSRLRTDIQLYPASAPQSAFNRLLALEGPLPAGEPHPGFSLRACYGPDGGCLYARPGACQSGAPPLEADPGPRLRRILAGLGYGLRR